MSPAGVRQTLRDPESTRFRRTERLAEAHLGRMFVNRYPEIQCATHFDPMGQAMAKRRYTEPQGRVVDACPQMHGGMGYLATCSVARAFLDELSPEIVVEPPKCRGRS